MRRKYPLQGIQAIIETKIQEALKITNQKLIIRCHKQTNSGMEKLAKEFDQKLLCLE